MMDVAAALDCVQLRGLTPAPRVSPEQFARMVASERSRFDVRRLSRGGVDRACRGKVPLGRKRALRAARMLRDRQGDDARAYTCALCSRFHVGHPPAGFELWQRRSTVGAWFEGKDLL